MALNLEEIDRDVLDALRKRGNSDEDITAMTPEQAFDEWCEWEGFHLWGGKFRRVLDNLRHPAPEGYRVEDWDEDGFHPYYSDPSTECAYGHCPKEKEE